MELESAPPNGCAVCNAPERGHDRSHDYAPPTDTLRLLRMKARRETRLNPPPPATAPPDTYVTLTARDGDFIDALQYALGALSPRPPELAAERFRQLANCEVTFDSTHMDAFDMERTIRARCRCSLTPAGVDVDFLVDAGDGPAGPAVDPELDAARHWTEHGSVCAHVCGGSPDHRCDAKASTSITHPLPSGGKRTLPLCGPCHAAESTAAEVAS